MQHLTKEMALLKILFDGQYPAFHSSFTSYQRQKSTSLLNLKAKIHPSLQSVNMAMVKVTDVQYFPQGVFAAWSKFTKLHSREGGIFSCIAHHMSWSMDWIYWNGFKSLWTLVHFVNIFCAGFNLENSKDKRSSGQLLNFSHFGCHQWPFQCMSSDKYCLTQAKYD